MHINSLKQIFNRRKGGSVLLEMIIVIGVIGLVAGTIGGIFYANQRGSEVGRVSTIASNLTQEALEAIKVVATANDATSQGWNRIYCPPATAEPTEGGSCVSPGSKGAPDDNPYRVEVVSNSWQFYQGSESLSISGETYTRAIYLENVCRDDTTGAITGSTDSNGSSNDCTTSGGSEDPLTQKITVKISPPLGNYTSTVFYLTRSVNKQTSPSTAPAAQSDWSGGKEAPAACSVVTSFSGNQYCDDDGNPDVAGTPGSIKILLQ